MIAEKKKKKSPNLVDLIASIKHYQTQRPQLPELIYGGVDLTGFKMTVIEAAANVRVQGSCANTEMQLWKVLLSDRHRTETLVLLVKVYAQSRWSATEWPCVHVCVYKCVCQISRSNWLS